MRLQRKDERGTSVQQGAGLVRMPTLPLAIIPAFLAPMFMIVHIIMLMRDFEARKNQQ